MNVQFSFTYHDTTKKLMCTHLLCILHPTCQKTSVKCEQYEFERIGSNLHKGSWIIAVSSHCYRCMLFHFLSIKKILVVSKAARSEYSHIQHVRICRVRYLATSKGNLSLLFCASLDIYGLFHNYLEMVSHVFSFPGIRWNSINLINLKCMIFSFEQLLAAYLFNIAVLTAFHRIVPQMEQSLLL